MSLPSDSSSPPAIPASSADDAPEHPATLPPIPETTNADPLTGEPGAHPVGVGIGAATTGVVGAALGAIAGPLGVIAGTAAGALAGGLLGKQAAETVNPTVESETVEATPREAPGGAATAGVDAEPAAPAATPVVPEATTSPSPKIALPRSTTIIARTSYPEGNVRVAAYYRYLHRRDEGAPGDEIEDWVEAEKQVLRVD